MEDVKKKLKFLILTVLCFTLYYCKQEEKPEVLTQTIGDDLVLVVNNSMPETPISIFKKIDFKTNEVVHIYTEKEHDTLNIEVDKYENLYLASKLGPRIPLTIRAGDSLFVAIKDGKLTYNISKTRHYAIPELSPDLQQKKKQLDKLNNLIFPIDSSLTGLSRPPSKFETYEPHYGVNTNREFLSQSDSLKSVVALELAYLNDASKYYDSLASKQIIDPELNKLLKEDVENDIFERLLWLNNHLEDSFIVDKLTSKQFINDALVDNKNLMLLLNSYLHEVVLQDQKSSPRARFYTDYKLVYDRLPDYLDGDILMYARMLCLNRMIEGDQKQSSQDIADRYNDFKKHHKDSVFTNSFDNKVIFELSDLRNIKNDVVLVQSNHGQVTLESIIKNNKNKLIYVDFWASWCIPCLVSMPDMVELKSEYKDQDVVFVYISIDTDASKWKKAAQREGLYASENSLLAINYPAADFFKDLKLETIPRYILFDKNGMLIHENAPGPGTSAIRELLDRHL